MVEQELTYEDRRAIFQQAAVMAVEREPKASVVSWLVAEGIDESEAEHVVSELYKKCSETDRELGQKNILYGGLWLVGGLAVTLGSYWLAARSGGGVYLVTSGALVWGAAQLAYGVYQCARS
jgi:hypothetical protein